LALLSMVEMGQGVAFLTENICTYDAKVRLLPIISEKQTGRIHVAAGLSDPGNHLVDLFLDHVEQNIQK
ncbi:MAG: hypothetical protein IKX89_01315, partial [Firmicutes bacterium]|nr:hypothetical protein [Bacillota bacterium]